MFTRVIQIFEMFLEIIQEQTIKMKNNSRPKIDFNNCSYRGEF